MKRLIASLAILTLTIVASSVSGQTPSTPAAFKSIEYLLLGDATRGAGEPMLAVDPTNPKNIIAVAMGTLTELPPPPPGGSPGTQSIPRSTIPWLAVTHDGGVTWQVGELPIMSGTLTRCPDVFADVTKTGVFIAGCEPRETTGAQYGMSALTTSGDKGITWGPRADVISSFGAARFAAGLKPQISGASPWDRPYTYIDDSTGVIYGVAKGGSTNIDGATRSQAYITSSTDEGKTFGTIYSWDSKDYPQLSRGIDAAAGGGAVYVSYVASRAPAADGATCPCTVLGLSRDLGKTFTYHVLKNIPPIPAPPEGARGAPGARGARGGPPAPQTTVLANLSADQNKPGRVAMLTYTPGSMPEYRVLISEDYGSTWSASVVAGQTSGAQSFAKPAFEYSRDGAIGLIWRAIYADGTYDIWASISRDGGKRFRSLPVSHQRSPASLPLKGTGNDDIQDLSMDKENVHLVWGDFRSGFLGTWYGRVPFSAFDAPGQ